MQLPAMQETQVQLLGQEDPLEKEMETHSSILAWEIPWTEEPWTGYSPWSRKSRTQFSNKPPPPILYMKVVSRVNPKSFHHKEKKYFCFIL